MLEQLGRTAIFLSPVKVFSNPYNKYAIIEEKYYESIQEAHIVFLRGRGGSENKIVKDLEKVTRTITLNNKNLEELEKNPDKLISEFANDIVRLSGIPLESCPSWYKKECREQNKENKIRRIKNEYERERYVFKKQERKIKRELNKDKKSESSIGKNDIKKIKNTLKLNKKEIHKIINEEIQNCEDYCKNIQPLNTEENVDLNFKSINYMIVVKTWGGMVPMDGIYIIRNRETNRFYVGKSKNVRRSVGQHFDGRKPTNEKLLYDYDHSPEPDTMFEYAVLTYNSKTDLDKIKNLLIRYFATIARVYNHVSKQTLLGSNL